MADQWVLASQQWLNKTFGSASGWTKVTEDGNTGQGTVNGLIEGLQNLLGISPVVPSFGPTTWTKLQAHGNVTSSDSVKWVTLVQAALYCKGYSGSSLDGKWADTLPSVKQLSADLGLSSSVTGLTPKMFRALLTTDPAVKIAGGSDAARAAQQYLNATYGSHTSFYYNSTGGVFDRPTQQNLVRGIQYELGQTDSAADGAFGPGTGGQLKSNTASVVRVGSTGRWVALFKAALIFNGYPLTFNSTFTSTDSAAVKRFQQFEGFTTTNLTGIGDYATWAELIVSTGDPNRPGAGADMASTITAARAQSLKAAGYTIVGRYLTNEQATNPLDKQIKPGELNAIFSAGLRLWPIFEEGGYQTSWFTSAQGKADALRAHAAARNFGIPEGTTIYFAVDVDVTEDQTRAIILPYFRGIAAQMLSLGNPYSIGIYGPRNTCQIVTDAGLARNSYIAGLSTGFSGNLGFPLPSNWAFNQIQTLTVGSGSGAVEIDKNVVSGRDRGIASVNSDPNGTFFSWLDFIQGQARAWKASGKGGNRTENELVLEYLRFPTYGKGGKLVGGFEDASTIFNAIRWDVVAGVTDTDFYNSVEASGVVRINSFTDPSHWNAPMDVQHLAAVMNATVVHPMESDGNINIGDGGGWVGDFITQIGSWKTNAKSSNIYSWLLEHIGTATPDTNVDTFPMGDLFQDVDGWVLGMAVAGSPDVPVASVIRDYYSSGGDYVNRFDTMYRNRFGGTDALMLARVADMFTQSSSTAFGLFRALLAQKATVTLNGDLSTTQQGYAAQAFVDKFNQYRAG